LLAALQVSKHLPGTTKYVPGIRSFSDEDVPNFPARPPSGFFEYGELGKAFSVDQVDLNDRSRTLRILFGHDKALDPDQSPAADAVLERQLGQAFFANDTKAGTKFLEAFREGRSPEWLKALCRDFARDELGWSDSVTWPQSLRETP
jgi:hypothetical protein